MACKESIQSRTSELQLLVESHAVLSVHLHVVNRCASLLHLHDPVLRQVWFHNGVFSTLQYKERRLAFADMADGPPFRVIGPRSGATNLCGRRTTGSAGNRTIELLPGISSIVESLANRCQACHERQVSASRVSVGSYAVRVNAQLLSIRLHPAYGAAHVFDTGRHRSLLHQPVVHVAHHVALQGIVNHQCAIHHVILRTGTPSTAVYDEDGRSVFLRPEERLGEVEHSAWPHVGSVRNVLSHGNLLLCLHAEHAEKGNQD